ncbi:fatty acid desaturase [Pseudotabrizicola algicola]|uniref:Fatty acid desaturase n=1 Tax=Pseudotabrizicola algicola TaxID=2709381 RepID=A0A6B3RPY9_9RHOB|nr:fatty acid desaturase [Pseudotabrizicola algicola]NEX46828.1 fatty acid desaturase [Pseudotabrizicola algicola]
MTMMQNDLAKAQEASARKWVPLLAKYRDPSTARSLFELAVTLAGFLAFWGAAWAALSVSPWLAVGLAVLNGFWLVRLFLIQHDCGHQSFFASREVNDWVGRAIGVLTLTPYTVWKRTHSIHHAHAGNLDRRGIGDVLTLTVEEYHKRSWLGRLLYRAYRHPLVMFGIGPAYLFMLEYRLPLGLMTAGWRYWLSAMGTNLVLAALLAGLYLLGGWQVLAFVFAPTVVAGATIGVWLFFVQHQFEETYWDQEAAWQVHDAALLGSSHYKLPQPLRWMTANIGIHHVHHLYSRIPFYRLSEILRDYPALAEAQVLTLRESLSCARLHLWDEAGRRLVSFREGRQVWAAQAA